MAKSKMVLPKKLHIVKGAVRVPSKSLGAVAYVDVGRNVRTEKW
jgi:hypothetical protein